ncbi:hypothetical protein AEAC466_20530 [Asticcacaulis sp. AC466]|uniref:adenosine kinase n=1 Tax=Asticcacaulis sp. AC466 TaxID=1282362 RepID=UPI0003C405A4|nr:adenosine kinase [Asticcacaulis sp. AC466]ESQ81684.1 hypothetical protein AEAC466_20530 [Asticcacaulis sp. AC466]
MTTSYDITAVGHAIVDVLAQTDEAFLTKHDLHKGAMTLIDAHRALSLSGAMQDTEMASGGSAGNTISGAASFGAKCAYVGKVAHDALGEFFAHDLKKMNVHFQTPVLHDDPTPTARCLINVTPDGQRTMATFLGAAALISPKDIEEEVIKASQITYLEGYLFDSPSGRETFAKAAEVARSAGRKTAITLSDGFVVNRWRDDLLAFIDRHIDLVFANETELLAMFETDDFYKALRYLRGKTDLAFVTRSAEGSVVAKMEDTHVIKAAPCPQVVDTTGAGDQYAAGVLFGLTQGLHVTTCAELGSLAAAHVIGHIGPRAQVSLKQLATERGLI